MDTLIARSNQLVRQADRSFVRFLYDQIQWDWRLIGIRGLRGVGKTTLMLQGMPAAHAVGKTAGVVGAGRHKNGAWQPYSFVVIRLAVLIFTT